MTINGKYISRGCEVKVGESWYPVCGFALIREKSGASGSVFTLKPNGATFEPCLGYRIDYSDIEDIREEAI